VWLLGEQSGESTSNGGTGINPSSIGGNGIYGGGNEWSYSYFGDTGTAARFFYQAKASRREREAGLEGNAAVAVYGNGGASLDGISHSSPTRNHHPTVKPLAVCEYMARLIVPPEPYRDDAVLLVPYAGSGSEMIGAFQAGWRNIHGCELELEYVEIAEQRIAHWCKQPALLP
jgi:site-specific DNA-methyltransferase (adenine-specific)